MRMSICRPGSRAAAAPVHVLAIGDESGRPGRMRGGSGPGGYLRADGDGVRDAVCEAVLDALDFGVLVVNASRKVVRMNRAAGRMLQDGSILNIRDGRLATDAPDESRRLAALVSVACHDAIGGEIRIASSVGSGMALGVRVVPIAVGAGLAAVIISPTRRHGHPTAIRPHFPEG